MNPYNNLKSAIIELYYLLRKAIAIHIKGKKEYLKDYKVLHDTAGINLFGFIDGIFGVGEAARSILKSINKANIPVSIIGMTAKGHSVDESLTKLSTNNIIRYNINLFCVNAEQTPYLKIKYNKSVWKNKYNIAYWFWELSEFPKQWIKYTKYYNEIWVASDFVLKSIESKATVTVKKIPLPISLDHKEHLLLRNYFDLKENQFIFLFIYDELSYRARKNPEAVISAFSQAFSKDECVQLIIKVNNLSNRQSVGYYNSIQEQFKNVRVFDQTMTRNEVNSLINSCNVYVSLHRAEGWGLTLAEAMFYGKPVIATNWSGNTDFMNQENSCPVNYTLVPITEGEGPYRSRQLWAEPNIVQAADYMRRLYYDQNFYNFIANNAERTMKTNYSLEKTAYSIEKRVNEILKEKCEGR